MNDSASETPADPTEPVDRSGAVSGRVASHVVDRLRTGAEQAGERGVTSIADDVVGKIVGIATRSVPGVYGFGPDRGISVRLDGSWARVELNLVIEYGVPVHPVTAQVRAAVIGAIEKMLGLQVTEVNIVIDDVHVGEAEHSPGA